MDYQADFVARKCKRYIWTVSAILRSEYCYEPKTTRMAEKEIHRACIAAFNRGVKVNQIPKVVAAEMDDYLFEASLKS